MSRGTRGATRAKAIAAASKSYTVETGHTHENKVLLDGLTITQPELDQIETDSHVHANMTLLNGLTTTQATITQLETDSHTHSNKALLDGLTTTQATLTQLETDSHTHGQTLETTSNVEFAKLILNNLPTIDPVNAGEVWNDAGVLKISSGT